MLINSGLYEQAVIVGKEADMDESFNALWKSLDEFESGESILYPDRLLEMLRVIR